MIKCAGMLDDSGCRGIGNGRFSFWGSRIRPRGSKIDSKAFKNQSRQLAPKQVRKRSILWPICIDFLSCVVDFQDDFWNHPHHLSKRSCTAAKTSNAEKHNVLRQNHVFEGESINIFLFRPEKSQDNPVNPSNI